MISGKWIAICVLIFCLSVVPCKAEALDINSDHTFSGVVTGPVVITGNCTVTLDGVTLDASSFSASAIKVNDGVTATIVLVGTSTLTGAMLRAGIHVPAGAALTVSGDGILDVTGSMNSAGIGGNPGEVVGTITIAGGTVKAHAGGGGGGAAGIGGSTYGGGGMITITGGTVTANGTKGGAGIGGGEETEGGTITITGGTVEAKGSTNAAGIGGGTTRGAKILISGGVVKATGVGDSVDDIGRGWYSIPPADPGSVTITGGSVNPTRWTANTDSTTMRIFDPKNANGVSLERKAYTGIAGATISFGVDATPPYLYTFTVPSDTNAYLWLPSAATLPTANADISLTMTATAQAGGIGLSASKNGGNDSATGYAWQRSTAPTGSFADLANTTPPTYVDTTANDGTTYYYRVAPIVAGKIAVANPYSNAVSATMPWLTGLTIDAGTLTPAFASGTTSYTMSVANSVSKAKVTPTTDTTGAEIKVNTIVVASGSESGEISLIEGANAITVTVGVGTAVKIYTIAVTRAGSGGGPVAPPSDTAQNLSTLLSTLNAALNPGASVTGLSSVPSGVGTPITKAVLSNAAFAKKDAPTAAFPGHTVLTPSFSSSVTLGGDTTGNVLALKCTINMNTLPGFESWGTLTEARRAALLDSLKVIFAYEYADKTWKTLVGAGGIISWADALKAGIVAFTATGLSLNYAVTDAAGDPAASGDVLVIPDGTKDSKIVDPVWLLKGAVVPTALTLTPSSLSLKKGESAAVKATFTPTDATERDVLWTVGESSLVSVTKAASVDTWTVKGLSEGIAKITATASADRNVKKELSVSVLPVETDLIESLTVSPPPPYHPGGEVEVLAKLKRPASSVTATVQRPDGKTDTPAVTVDGTSAWLTYTLPELGSYAVTVKATDTGTGTVWTKTATLTVTEGGAKGGGSGGGCNSAGLALLALALGAALPKRR